MLTNEQTEFYRENGYLLIEGAIAPEPLAAMQRVTADLIERSRAVPESDDVYDLDEGHGPDTPRLTRIKLPHTRDAAYADVLHGPRLAALLEPLIGPNIRLHTSKLNTKAPGGGAAVEWHQDWAFYPHTNDDILAVGIMLEDVDEANGPLMVIPGSHRRPMLSHHRNGVFCGAIDPADPLFEPEKAVTITGKAGDMSIHHVRVLHGSAPNRSDRARKLLFFEMMAADAWPLMGVAGVYQGLSASEMWYRMKDNLVCGEQSSVPRLEAVPVSMPLPLPSDASSIFKVQKSGGAISAFG